MIDLNLMAIFARVVEAESFAEAARRMNTSRSAVSKAVAKLEKALGARLVNRTTRHLSLTEIAADYERDEGTRVRLSFGASGAVARQVQAGAPADVVILAEGTNSMLSERCLGNARPKADQMAVGIKEVFELPSGVIEDRFLLPEGEGAAMLFVGDCTHGKVGGGFLYTNRDSISLGLVATISLAADGANETPEIGRAHV